MDGQPTATELNEIKGRVATIRAVLENAGFLDSPGATTGITVSHGTVWTAANTKVAGWNIPVGTKEDFRRAGLEAA